MGCSPEGPLWLDEGEAGACCVDRRGLTCHPDKAEAAGHRRSQAVWASMLAIRTRLKAAAVNAAQSWFFLTPM